MVEEISFFFLFYRNRYTYLEVIQIYYRALLRISLALFFKGLHYPNAFCFLSASRRLLVVPWIHTSSICTAVVLLPLLGPSVWNSLGNDLRDPDLNIASFGRLLKTATHLFQQYSVH